VERVGQGGLPVDVQIDGTPRPLPPGLDLTAYRIVQEALTNTLKYARGARAHVHVTFDEGELRVQVIDTGAATTDTHTTATGRGLLGMKERVAIYGGDLESGRRPEGGFAVTARLPL
jgi:signal transduction histidine kinase